MVKSRDNQVDKELVRQLIDGTISAEDARELLRMERKDKGRFHTYIEILQERVQWDDRILLRISDHLFIVSKGPGDRVTKCTCGQEFGDYRVNWKLAARVRTRKSQADIDKVYNPVPAAPETGWQEVREFFCPGCAAQLAVEVVPPGYPFIFESLPDLDRFYAETLQAPLPDAASDWYEDRTAQQTVEWHGDQAAAAV
jgi:acetone carboxylase, gamma subunit